MRGKVARFLLKLGLSLACGAVLAVGWVVFHSPDPYYAAYEVVFAARFHRYDAIIQDVAGRRGVDPMVIKAVIWRESRFRPEKVGHDGERGLMQVTDAAAGEWAKAERVNFAPPDLFDPKTNIEAGTWLLARALRRYQAKDNPLPFALAEYNAGRSRVSRWSTEKAAAGQPEAGADSQEMRANIDIPSTRRYVEAVQERVQFYHDRGRL